jgi:hypothetical protein
VLRISSGPITTFIRTEEGDNGKISSGMNPKGVGGDSAAADERKVQQKYFILKD